MINQKLFKKIKDDFDFYKQERGKIISISNEILIKAKQAIFAFHRDDIKGGNDLLFEVENIFNDLEKKIKKEAELRYEGSYRAALEEYVEAKLFGNFLATGKIDEIKEVSVDYDSYLAGLCDMTGELTRKAVLKAIDKKFKDVEFLVAGIREVIAELLKFNLTSYLRTKYDQAKNNLRRAEEVLYDVKMKE